MDLVFKNAEVVKNGVCIYSDCKTYQVKIIKWHTLYGTGDREDLPEIAENRPIPCFYVLFEDLMNEGVFNTSGGGFLSIDEAICSVERFCSVRWQIT